MKRATGEQTPLLGSDSIDEGQDDGSAETLLNSSASGADNSDDGDENAANQKVGKGRGLLIILSLWGLIFLQGKN